MVMYEHNGVSLSQYDIQMFYHQNKLQFQLHIPSSRSLIYLLMSNSASNALSLRFRTPISVFMISRSSCRLVNIAKYGEEYRKDEESPINVLFHGYGHYDLLESFSEESCQK